MVQATLDGRRVLLKLSGEALMGDDASGINMDTVGRMAGDVAEVARAGAQVCLVIGGGNIFRGLAGAAQGMDRGTADYMGMLATVMNALAFNGALEQADVKGRVMSAIPMPTVCEPFTRPRAHRHLEKGRVVVFGGGTGNPFFTTDTAAALRAVEMGCDTLLKGTQVDGIYDSDPRTNPDASRFDSVSYDEVLKRDLKVMDGAAIALARDNHLPIVVFNIGKQGEFLRVLSGASSGTTVTV